MAAVALGGALGACARHGLGVLFPSVPGGWPTATFVANVFGSLLLGALLVVLLEVSAPMRLARPLLGTGLLGGFTTYSAFAVEARELAAGGRAGLSALYVAATVMVTLVAVRLGASGVRVLARVNPQLNPCPVQIVDPLATGRGDPPAAGGDGRDDGRHEGTGGASCPRPLPPPG